MKLDRTTVNAIPEGMHTITPHFVVRDAARAAEWYTTVFGAVERSRVPLPNGKIMSLELRIGDSTVMIADEFPEMDVLSPLSVGGTVVVFNVYTSDVDGLWRRAVEAGAEIAHPLRDAFWGDRQGQVIDPFGHKWGLAQHIRNVPPDEITRAAAATFGA